MRGHSWLPHWQFRWQPAMQWRIEVAEAVVVAGAAVGALHSAVVAAVDAPRLVEVVAAAGVRR
jgi:hypothetical protein